MTTRRAEPAPTVAKTTKPPKAKVDKATKAPAPAKAAPPPAQEASGPGPSGRSDGAVARARDALSEAVAATASNAFLAPLLLVSLALVLAAATAPAVAESRFRFRLRPMLEHRAYFALMGLSGLAAWAVVAIGGAG